MFRVLCINNKYVYHLNGSYSTGDGLIEGNIYTVVDDIIYIHPNNKKECYLIAEFNHLKLTSRFIRVSDPDETELMESKEEECIVL